MFKRVGFSNKLHVRKRELFFLRGHFKFEREGDW